MISDGQEFLNELAKFPASTFEAKFLKLLTQMGLDQGVSAGDLRLLYRAAFRSVLCNLAFNGLGGCGGEIKPERENNRIRLEREFMAAQDKWFGSAAWQRLDEKQRQEVKKRFLTVLVAERNFAWQ